MGSILIYNPIIIIVFNSVLYDLHAGITVAAAFVLIFVLVISMLTGYGIYRVKQDRQEKMKEKQPQPVEPLVAIMAKTR